MVVGPGMPWFVSGVGEPEGCDANLWERIMISHKPSSKKSRWAPGGSEYAKWGDRWYSLMYHIRLSRASANIKVDALRVNWDNTLTLRMQIKKVLLLSLLALFWTLLFLPSSSLLLIQLKCQKAFFYKGPDSKYFRLCKSYNLCHTYTEARAVLSWELMWAGHQFITWNPSAVAG